MDGRASVNEGVETGTVNHAQGLILLNYCKGRNSCGKPAAQIHGWSVKGKIKAIDVLRG